MWPSSLWPLVIQSIERKLRTSVEGQPMLNEGLYTTVINIIKVSGLRAEYLCNAIVKYLHALHLSLWNK